jgi:hypothetical protein
MTVLGNVAQKALKLVCGRNMEKFGEGDFKKPTML